MIKNLNKKILILLFFVFILTEIVSAITTIAPNIVYPGDTITLTISPNKKLGFYNIIYVMKNNSTVDSILVNCPQICKIKRTVYYTVPSDFLGQYYFATFDYAINNYELDYFNVIEQGGSPSGTLTIEKIQNVISGINFLVNPEQGKRANINISVLLNTQNCQNYNVTSYLCNSSISNCNRYNYTYNISLKLARRILRRCWFGYTGEDYFPFYLAGGQWKIIAISGITYDENNFTYSSLKAINISSIIDFGILNSDMWNIGVPSSGEDIINHGNLPVELEWYSNGFKCISENCTDFWPVYYQGENTFQIDDDSLFLEQNETGLQPAFITNSSSNYFPQAQMPTCISDLCSSGNGEKIKTYFNLKLPSIQKGEYEGNINITIR